MGFFDLQLYPCVNGKCPRPTGKPDLINIQKEPESMIDWRPNALRPGINNVTATVTVNSSFNDSQSDSLQPNWIATATSSTWYSLRDDSWVVPLLTLSSVNILLILLLEILVLFKVRKKTSKPPQLFLGQTLLLALLFTSILGYSFLLTPTRITCAINQQGLGLSYALIYGTLLVKSVFLLSLHTGTYLPLLYQFLLLFFIMSTQIVITLQSLIHSPTELKSISFDQLTNKRSSTPFSSSESILSEESIKEPLVTNKILCAYRLPSYLISLSYNILLLLIVSIISFRIRRHRENYREALFIAIAGLTSILVWITWIAGSLISPEPVQDAFIAFGLQVNASIVFLVMFTPKAKQLIKLNWSPSSGLSDDDTDDMRIGGCGGAEHSGHDSSQSLCAQSFVHLKPNYDQPQHHGLPSNHHHHHHHPSNRPNHHRHHRPPLPPPPPPQQQHHYHHPMDSLRSQWSFHKHLLSNGKSSQRGFISTNTLLKSMHDDPLAFYRLPNVSPIKIIYPR